jgi:hypothetical protein
LRSKGLASFGSAVGRGLCTSYKPPSPLLEGAYAQSWSFGISRVVGSKSFSTSSLRIREGAYANWGDFGEAETGCRGPSGAYAKGLTSGV